MPLSILMMVTMITIYFILTNKLCTLNYNLPLIGIIACRLYGLFIFNVLTLSA